MRERADDRELGEDQLDLALGPVARRWSFLPRRRPALGLGTLGSSMPLYVLAGVLLGPSGVHVITAGGMYEAQTIAWVALAVLGVFVGIGFHTEVVTVDRPVLITAAAIAAVTVAAIAGGLYFEITASPSAAELIASPLLASAILAAICAAVSAALLPRNHASIGVRAAVRLADLDDVPLVLAGTTLVAVLAGEPILWRLAATLLGGGAIGVAGWLLFDRATEDERGLYVAGAVLLLAGIGAYLSTSPLLAGWSAAILWARLPGVADRITVRDLQRLQHPLVALLLVLAGALIDWSPITLWAAASLVILRIAGKLIAALVVSRFAGVSPAVLASVLLHPGVMGIALAINARLVLGEAFAWIASAVTIATVIAEVIAIFLPDVEGEAA